MNVRIRDAKPSDQEFLAHGNEAMALETEHKRLDPVTIKALTVYVAIATMVFNLLADLMYKAVDPRVQLK